MVHIMHTVHMVHAVHMVDVVDTKSLLQVVKFKVRSTGDSVRYSTVQFCLPGYYLIVIALPSLQAKIFLIILN